MSTSTTNRSGSNQLRSILAVILILILLIANIFLLRYYLENSRKISLLNTDKTQIEMNKLELAAAYYQAMNDLNNQKGSDEKLNAIIEEQKISLTQLQEENNRLAASGANTEIIKREITKMRTQTTSYLAEINRLRGKTAEVEKALADYKVQNTKLTSDKIALGGKIDTLTNIVASNAEKARLEAAAKAAVEAENQRMATAIAKASYIRIDTVKIFPQREKGSKVKSTDKAKRVDQYSICIDLLANDLIGKGQQSFYLRMLDGSDTPVKMGDDECLSDGKPVRFTQKVLVDYDGNPNQKCITWIPSEKLSAGKYKIDVFNNGHFVGQSSFDLK